MDNFNNISFIPLANDEPHDSFIKPEKCDEVNIASNSAEVDTQCPFVGTDVFEHDHEQLRNYYLEKRYCVAVNVVCIGFALLVGWSVNPVIGGLVIYMVLFPANPLTSIILKFIRPRLINRINIEQTTETSISPNGIRHVQPRLQDEPRPYGGEVLIPFDDIEDVEVGLTYSTFVVTKVDIKLKEHMQSNDLTRLVVKGYPFFSKPLKYYKLEICGLISPHNFKRAAMENMQRSVSLNEECYSDETDRSELPVATLLNRNIR